VPPAHGAIEQREIEPTVGADRDGSSMQREPARLGAADHQQAQPRGLVSAHDHGLGAPERVSLARRRVEHAHDRVVLADLERLVRRQHDRARGVVVQPMREHVEPLATHEEMVLGHLGVVHDDVAARGAADFQRAGLERKHAHGYAPDGENDGVHAGLSRPSRVRCAPARGSRRFRA
jgi:hypothetical protein